MIDIVCRPDGNLRLSFLLLESTSTLSIDLFFVSNDEEDNGDTLHTIQELYSSIIVYLTFFRALLDI